MSEDLSGRRLGHYRVEAVIGRGGMSVLYRATDMRLGRKVALKVIGDQLAADPEFRERFVDEARNTSAIDHPHVVPLYDFDEVDGRLYIAMRYVEGSDLASLIKDGPISATRTLALLGQVADALDALHGRGLVHLDVKPANVLVTQRESAGIEHVYLGDFGLTRRGATGHRTRSGDFLGSPTYAAPEHLRGEPVDGRTDQYSLTCVLFACLTGRPPFPGKVPEVIASHLGSEPPAVTRHVLLPVPIDEVVSRGMAKDTARRYASCRELLTAARAALATEPARPAAAPGSRPGSPPGPPSPAGSPAAGSPAAPGSSPATPGSSPVPSSPSSPAAPSSPDGRGSGSQQPAARAGAPSGPPRQPGRGPTGPPGYPSQPPVSSQPPRGWPDQDEQRTQPPVPPAQTGYPASSSQRPVRLRDPLPVQPSAFTRTGSRGSWWIPMLLTALAIGVIIAVIIVLMSRGNGGGGPGPTTEPTINVPSGSRTLPTEVPTVTSRR